MRLHLPPVPEVPVETLLLSFSENLQFIMVDQSSAPDPNLSAWWPMPDQRKLRMSRALPQFRGMGGYRIRRQQQNGVVLAAVATEVAELQEKFGEREADREATGSSGPVASCCNDIECESM